MTGVSHENPVWNTPRLLKRLVSISVTSTAFPPTRFPHTTPPSSPLLLLSPPRIDPRVFPVFWLAQF